jgi:heme-degrading monooxygenase HmoA
MTHVRVWTFRPPPEREQDFAEAYGPCGVWAQLFAEAGGFLGTTLLRPSEAGGWWMTIDRWASASDFDAFQRDFRDRYRTLDAELEGVAGDETFIGTFEEPD